MHKHAPRTLLVMMLILLALPSIACQFGPGATAVPLTATPTPTMIPTVTPTPAPARPILQPGISVTNGDLQFRLTGYYLDPHGNIQDADLTANPNIRVDCHTHLVLTKPPQSVTASDINTIQTYLTSLPVGGFPGLPLGTSSPAPDPLIWLNGALTGDGCLAGLRITNLSTSHTSIISAVGMHLLSQPEPNTTDYALLDVCTWMAHPNTCDFVGGGYFGACHFGTEFTLPSSAGLDVVSDQVHGIGSNNPEDPNYCPPGGTFTITPGASALLTISINPPAPQSSLIYRLRPYVTTDQGTVELPELETVVAFASDAQLHCYGLDNSTLVGVPLEEKSQDGSGRSVHLCL
jgi:hypothetical protein